MATDDSYEVDPAGLGHKMGHFHDGIVYCMNQDCSASARFEGPLTGGILKGTATTEQCPYTFSDARKARFDARKARKVRLNA